MRRSLLAIMLSVSLLFVAGGQASAHPRLNSARPGAVGFLYCMNTLKGNIHLYLCATDPTEIPDPVVLAAMLEGLTAIYDLKEVFEIDAAIIPMASTFWSGFRGFYFVQNGFILVKGSEPDQYRLTYVLGHEIAHGILDQVKGLHGTEHHDQLVCQDELHPIKTLMDYLAGEKLVYDDARVTQRICGIEGT